MHRFRMRHDRRRLTGSLHGLVMMRFQVVQELLDHEIDQRLPVPGLAVMAALLIGSGLQLGDGQQAGKVFFVPNFTGDRHQAL